MNFKRIIRLLLLALMIGLACVLPVPLNVTRKDNLPKNLIEKVELEQEADEDEELAKF